MSKRHKELPGWRNARASYFRFHGWRKRDSGSNQWCGYPLFKSTKQGVHCKTCGDTQIKDHSPYAYNDYDGNPRRIKRQGSPPKPPAPPKTALTKRMDAASKKWDEGNDCAVYAVAIACGVTYEAAHGALALRGRNHASGTTTGKYYAAIKSFGFVLERMPHITDYNFLCEGPSRSQLAKLKHPLSRAKTMKQVSTLLPSRGVFLIASATHVLCARAGEIHDWSANRLHRVKSIYRIKRAPKEGDSA